MSGCESEKTKKQQSKILRETMNKLLQASIRAKAIAIAIAIAKALWFVQSNQMVQSNPITKQTVWSLLKVTLK